MTTLFDVCKKILHVQEMKLLYLQGVSIEGKHICIKQIVNEKALTKILNRYRDHFDDVMKYNNTITIFNLDALSLLRVGLTKQVLKFMIPYLNEGDPKWLYYSTINSIYNSRSQHCSLQLH
jgi:hypothetical protein